MFADLGVLNFWTYVIGAIFIALVPGPNTLYVLKTSVTQGIRQGYLAALGVFIGDIVLIFLAWAGVATLIKTTPLLFMIVRYLGALYLLYLGVKILYDTFRRQRPGGAVARGGQHATLKRGLILSMTNPKVILFYVSFFVQFIAVNAPHPGIAFLILAAVREMVSLAYLSFLIVAGAFLTRYIKTRMKLAKLGNGLIGLLFMGFAARLVTLRS